MSELVFPFMAAIVGALVTLLTIRVTKRKVLAEAAEKEATAAAVIQNASLALIAPLTLRIASLENEVRLLREQIEKQASVEEELRNEAARKEKRIRHLELVCKRAGINGD